MPCIYAPPAKFEKKNSIINNEVFFERGMSSDAKVLVGAINAIKCCAPNWVIIQSDLQNRLEFSKERMKKAMNDAIKFGYLKVVQVRQKRGAINAKNKGIAGQFFRNAFFFSLEKDFTDEAFTSNEDFMAHAEKQAEHEEGLSVEALEPSPEKPSTAPALTDFKRIPMPNKPMPDLKALKGNASLSQKPKAMASGATPKSRTRQFKRSPDKEELFEYLKSLEFGADKLKLSEDDASYLANCYSVKHVEDCYFDVCGKIDKGHNIRNPIGLFRKLLSDENCPRGKASQTNIAFAKRFAKDLGWSSLIIKDKYVIDSGHSGKDLSLNMEPAAFKSSLENLYMGIHGSFS